MKPRKLLLIALPVAALAVAATALVMSRIGRHWTTDSPEALAEFEQGLQDELKLYGREANEHYVRASELDPDFLAPKVRLLYSQRAHGMDKARLGELVADLRGRDLARLTPRERLQVQYVLAHIDHRPERAAELLADYLEDHPGDPFAIELECGELWSQHEWLQAEPCYRRLIAADPNWVEAQNRLGYILMAQGRFAAAEEQFEIYRYVAPDQPNPHDSLGELLLLLGRWREARTELEDAVRIKPDFCASWKNRLQLALFERDYVDADAVLARAEDAGGCPPDDLASLHCKLEAWRNFDDGRWEALVRSAEEGACGGMYGDVVALSFAAALRAGRPDVADRIQSELAATMAKYLEENPEDSPLTLYLDGVRRRLAGDPQAAAEKLSEADRRLAYWTADLGYLKLAVRLELVQALTEAGRGAESERLLAEVESVNPRLIERWRPLPARP